MPKSKRHAPPRDSAPAAAAAESKPRRGRPPRKAAPDVTPRSHAPRLIAIPSKGPGRRRMVPEDSLDGISVQLAHELGTEIAIKLVSKLRRITERMVRARLDEMLTKL